ncbi:MAG TPA: hypothetical protein VLS89_19480 [Candidatus Nanopelagicales bacterium]|nr:hypothetical protein [Candidatus Nanopelagicales bacterium]
MANKSKSDLDRWSPVAQEARPEELTTTTVPLHVLCGEAVDVAKFFEKYWEPQLDKGRVTRPGLSSAVRKGGKKGRFSAKTGEEILSLQRATQEAQTRYLLTVEKNDSPRARGEFLLGEMQAALGWLFDDGIEDEKDQMLARLEAAHEDRPGSNDALASALDDHAHLGEQYRDELDGLGGFEAGFLDEARQVAAALRARPAQAEPLSSEARAALDLRNRLASVLQAKMTLVRSAARFVFRRNPEIVREVTSAYERRKRAAGRRKEEAEATAAPAEG